MRVIALGSGSSGNATLIKAGGECILIDAGIPTRMLERTLTEVGVRPREIAAIFLTHEHSDHVAAAGVLARRYGLTIVANDKTLQSAAIGKVKAEIMPTGGSVSVGSLRIDSFQLPHDGRDPVGYCVEHEGRRVCLATDLGHVPLALREHIRAADLVILEANHDQTRLLNGPYPPSLKARVMSQHGHLSNRQAADCIVASVSNRPQWLWLAHLSDVNNSPGVALRTVSQTLSLAGIQSVRTAVALRDRRSLVWDSEECFVQPALKML